MPRGSRTHAGPRPPFTLGQKGSMAKKMRPAADSWWAGLSREAFRARAQREFETRMAFSSDIVVKEQVGT